MNTEPVDKIATAVLYEGYILYPYRPSLKNCRRTMFGAVYPRPCAEKNGERWSMQTECLLAADLAAEIEVQARFLHWTERDLGRALSPESESEFRLFESLEVDGRRRERWEEAVERRIDVPATPLKELVERPLRVPIRFAAARDVEWLEPVGRDERAAFIRRRHRLEGAVECSAQRLAEGLYCLRVRIENHTPCDDLSSGEVAQMAAFHSTHTLLHVAGGRWISAMDPPAEWGEFAAALENEGTWPVMAGDEKLENMVLSSPIILYDYPQVAAESVGDHFDATEIDEMLALRIATMTDDEKGRMRAVDEQARAILCRTERQAEDEFRNLHGTLRSLRRVDDQDQ